MLKYIALLTLSQLADLGSTAFGLARGAHEINPIFGFLMARGGISLLLSVKAAVVVLAALLMIRAGVYGWKYVRFVNRLVLSLSIIALLIATWNMLSWI